MEGKKTLAGLIAWLVVYLIRDQLGMILTPEQEMSILTVIGIVLRLITKGPVKIGTK